MSAQKQQQQQKGSSPKRELEADFLFNKHIVRTFSYAAAGFGFGLATSLLFKNKAGMTVFFSGVGAGYGATNLFDDLNHFRKYKSLGQNQLQGQGLEQLERRGAQLGQGLENAKNQAKGTADQAQNKLREGAQNLKEQGNDVARQAKNAGEQAYSKASQGVQNAKEQAKSTAEHLQNKANESLQNAKRRD